MTIDTPEGMQRLLDTSPYIRFLGLTVASLDVTNAGLVLDMAMKAELERGEGTGQFHGAPIAGLIDTAGACLVGAVTGSGAPTIDFRVDYLRPATGTRLSAAATARRVGRTVAVIDIDVKDDQDRLVAVGRGSFGAGARA